MIQKNIKRALTTFLLTKVKEARSSKPKGDLIKVNPENVWEGIESELEQHSTEISIKAAWFQDDRNFIRTASSEDLSMSLEWSQALQCFPGGPERFELLPLGSTGHN